MVLCALVRRALTPVVLAGLVAPSLMAQAEEQDAEEIARKLSNPTEPVFSLTSLIDYQTFKGDLAGANDQSSWTYLLQPPLPFELGGGTSFFIRPAIPVQFNQPVFTGTGFERAGVNLGNISADVSLGKTFPNGLILIGGTVWTLPTATDERLRANFAFGPEVAVGVFKPWGVALLLVTQSWDLSGDDKQSRLGGQYTLALSLGGGWQFVSGPPYSYNWDTKELTLPVGGGPFRTIIAGSTPIKVGVQAWYYVSQPDAFGPQWQLRFQIQPVLKRPW